MSDMAPGGRGRGGIGFHLEVGGLEYHWGEPVVMAVAVNVTLVMADVGLR
jgi:hypothetical protein